MKPLRTRLEQARQRTGMGWEVLERDYFLSWILAGISRHEPLRKTLVFKGGTALKKCYFGDYRFSEDLDSSGLAGVPVGAEMETSLDTSAGPQPDCWMSTLPWRSGGAAHGEGAAPCRSGGLRHPGATALAADTANASASGGRCR